jgi:flagellar hook-basal body complex protein FliE
MEISGIGTQSISALQSAAPNKGADATGGFQSILSDAMDAASSTDAASQAGAQALLTGDVNNLSDIVIESEKADIALSLAVQIRNRVIDAYNEVMRMQV